VVDLADAGREEALLGAMPIALDGHAVKRFCSGLAIMQERSFGGAMVKSTVDEIRQRFDNDVERFSNLETGQSATMDAPLILDLVSEAAATVCPSATSLLDIGCGAGNYTLKMLQRLPGLDCTLNDLSRPMLDRAEQRVAAASGRSIRTIQGDIREIDLPSSGFDVIVAAMVLHHMRDDAEWDTVFSKLHRSLKPGGALFVADHIEHDDPRLQAMFKKRWGDYLIGLKGVEYRDQVFAYTEKEDTPRSLLYQIDAMRRAGFRDVDVLHMTTLYAAWVGFKR
jgi:tRNA (cmo5U34)-methyltransferase